MLSSSLVLKIEPSDPPKDKKTRNIEIGGSRLISYHHIKRIDVALTITIIFLPREIKGVLQDEKEIVQALYK